MRGRDADRRRAPHRLPAARAEALDPALTAAVPSPRPGDYVFYVIGTWTSRKAIASLITAYLAAFTKHDAVTLVIHTGPEDRIAGRAFGLSGEGSRPAEASTWFALARLLAGRADPPRIVLSTRRPSPAGVRELHAGGNCFVTLSRGEGWGLGAFDAGAAGNPAILTGWGGSQDYLPAGYPYQVDYELIPTAEDPPDEWWEPPPGDRWAKANLEHAAGLMRQVDSTPDEAAARGGASSSTSSAGSRVRRWAISSWLALTAAEPGVRPRSIRLNLGCGDASSPAGWTTIATLTVTASTSRTICADRRGRGRTARRARSA